MSQHLTKTDAYKAFLRDIKQRVHAAQIKAALAVNRELLHLYWDLAEGIVTKQREAAWGDGFLQQMSHDLQAEFPDIRGFSLRNLKYMRQWFQFWSVETAIGQQLVAQIPWGHNLVIVSKTHSIDEATFYVQKTIENHWSRAVLTHHIEAGLYQRNGKAINNFQATLPAPHSDLAHQTLKDPYCFDFLMLRERHDERELEISAVDSLLKAPEDNPTIGILICKSKNDTVVEYALRDVQKPIGVSEYTITKHLPPELQSSLPSIADIEAELGEHDA